MCHDPPPVPLTRPADSSSAELWCVTKRNALVSFQLSETIGSLSLISMTLDFAPLAEKRFGTRVRSIHGDNVDDPWDWLRNTDDPDVIAHFEAENLWSDHVTAPLSGLRSTLVNEFRQLTIEEEVSAPVREGEWWYFRRFHAGQSYPTHHRLPAVSGEAPVLVAGQPEEGEILLIDENEHAKGEDFFRLTDLTPSPDGSLIAWARDVSGDERWTWIIQDADGRIVDKAVSDAGYGISWSADSSSFIYTRVDPAWRAHQVWLHTVGTPAEDDAMILWEPDEGFDVWISSARDPRWTAVHSSSTSSGQAWLWSREQPLRPLVPVTPREANVQIKVEPAGDHLLIVHTRTSIEGALAAVTLPDAFTEEVQRGTLSAASSCTVTPECCAEKVTPEGLGASLIDPSSWVSVREPSPGERISDVEAFSTFAVVSMRSDSLTQISVHLRAHPAHTSRLTQVDNLWDTGRFVTIESPVRSIVSTGDGNFTDTVFSIEHSSVSVPPTTEHVDSVTLERTVVHRQSVPGWNPDDYVEQRIWLTARDGNTLIPATVVHHQNVHPDGTNPGWIHGYGSYEIPFEAHFDILRLPALARGVVHVIAHIRGGGEMGRGWYEEGKTLMKMNTFTDFIDVSDWLVTSGWVAPERLAAEGRSAGGLLMGAVTNLAPDRYAAILAGVPFVDALTTILDPSLPLTVGEWEEWGNPTQDPQVFALMKAYSPYENVVDGIAYPAIMATTSLNDTRVFAVEPAKWVQRLREASRNTSEAKPIIMRTEMVAGHGGPSGRYGRWDAKAEEYAFILHHIGIDT